VSKAQFALGAILVGFLIYLAMNDRLKTYAALLFGGGSAASGSGTGGTQYLIPPVPSLGFPGVTK
jgi:hypothetical protein